MQESILESSKCKSACVKGTLQRSLLKLFFSSSLKKCDHVIVVSVFLAKLRLGSRSDLDYKLRITSPHIINWPGSENVELWYHQPHALPDLPKICDGKWTIGATCICLLFVECPAQFGSSKERDANNLWCQLPLHLVVTFCWLSWCFFWIHSEHKFYWILVADKPHIEFGGLRGHLNM